MRGLVAFLAVIAAIYGGFRYFVQEEPGKEAQASSSGQNLSSGSPPATGSRAARAAPEKLSVEVSPEGTEAPSGGRAEGALASVLRRLESGETPGAGDPELEAALAGPDGPSLRDALSDDPARSWLGLSRLCAKDELADDRWLVESALAAARAGATAPATSVEYVVRSGDSLYRICKRMKEQGIVTTPGLIRWANRIHGDRIVPGQRLRIPKGPFRITVSKAGFHLRAWLGDGLVRQYRIGIGKEDRTPAAEFVVDSRLEKPPWPHPETGEILHFGDPGYQIGTRWIGFADTDEHFGFGIHGTDDPDSIGRARSLGCIRLTNEDVEDLFELVPIGARVQIR